MINLRSSHLLGAEYISNTLKIVFRNGAVYHYYNVPASDFAALLKSKSPTGFLNSRIKPKYRFARILNPS